MAEYLSPSEAIVLRVLARSGENLIAAEIAERAGLKHGTVSNTLTRLLKRGLAGKVRQQAAGPYRPPSAWCPTEAGKAALSDGKFSSAALAFAAKTAIEAGELDEHLDQLVLAVRIRFRALGRSQWLEPKR